MDSIGWKSAAPSHPQNCPTSHGSSALCLLVKNLVLVVSDQMLGIWGLTA